MESKLERVNQLVLTAPLHAGANLRIVEQGGGEARVRFDVTPLIAGPSGMLHGGALYALMDTACYFALAPLLEGQDAVSHDVHFSVVRPVDAGSTLEVTTRVERKGRTVAFMRAEARRLTEGDGENPLVGLGTVTKTILAARPRST